MTLGSAKTRLLKLRGWEPNPVVVKELRQAVRSWAVTGMLMFFLVILFVAMIIILVNESFDITENTRAGAEVFGVFVVILAIASILFIPTYVGIRMAAERQENNADLLYISTLSPSRIIFGKFLCGAYMILLFFSACMPFMAFTNLLRGVDLPTVFLILALLFGAVCAANMLAIFVACLPVTRPFKVLLGLGQLILSIYLVIGAIVVSVDMMRFGAGSMMAAGRFWETVITVASIVTMVGGLFFVLSVTLISPPSANRALLPRIYITIIWALGGALASYWAWRDHEPSLIFAWASVSTLMLIGALLATISNRDELSPRVRRRIPQSLPLRALAFLFFNGAAGGLVWVTSLFILTFVASIEIYSSGAILTRDYSDFREVYPPLLAYILFYALAGLFIHRTYLRHRRATVAGIFALGLSTAATVGPNIVLFFMNELSWKTLQRLQLGNPSNLMGDITFEERKAHLWFACAVLAVALIVNAKWFTAQIKSFRSMETIAAPPVPAEIPPAIA